MSTLFMGVDAGGTGTRALLATARGEVTGVGRAGGANSFSSGTDVSREILDAIRQALGEQAAASVAGGVVAIAGGGATSEPIAAEIAAGWRALGLPGSPVIDPDVLAAFAAGTPAPGGIVVAVGTGSISAAIRDRRVLRKVGGHGWLVSDEGSAVWLGIEGTRAALRALDGRDTDTALATRVPDALGVDAEGDAARDAIVRAVYGAAPARLGRLAPTVIDAADDGDPTATSLVETAIEHIVELAIAAADDRTPETVVLAGSMLTRVASIGGPVRSILSERWPAVTLEEAVSGEIGSVALAVARSPAGPLDGASFERLREVAASGGPDTA